MYDESLLTSDVCVRCGACCSVYVRRGTTELVVLEEVQSMDEVEIIACPHLRSQDGLHVCSNYEQRPQVCRQYNCLSQANRNGLELVEGKAIASRVRQAVRQVFGREIEISLVD